MKNINQIAKLMKNEEFWLENAPMVPQLCIPWLKAFIRVGKWMKIKAYTKAMIIIKDAIGYELTLIKEQNLGFREVLKKQKKNREYLKSKVKSWRKSEKIFLNWCKKIEKGIRNLSNKELWKIYQGFVKAYEEEYIFPIGAEFADDFVQSKLLPIMKKEYPAYSGSQLAKYMSALAIPLHKSFIQEEKESMLSLCLMLTKEKVRNFKDAKKHKGFYNNLKYHAKRFFWINNNYKNAIILKPKHFFKNAKEYSEGKTISDIENEIKDFKKYFKELKEDKAKAKRILKLSNDLEQIFEVLEIFGWWIDHRKRYALIGDHYTVELLKEISTRTNYSFDDLKYFMQKEIKAVLLQREMIDKKKIETRKDCVVLFCEGGKIRPFTGEDAKRICKAYFERKYGKEIKGFVASAPVKKIKGKVKIIMDPHSEYLKEGMILVTSMTRPDFVPLMKKAKAIITDEGGITSHAAIVSRELGIPCVIGTKIATKILKDGMLVEVDADKGIVRLVK